MMHSRELSLSAPRYAAAVGCSRSLAASLALLAGVLSGTAASAASPATSAPTVESRYAAEQAAGEIPDFQRHVIPLISKLGCNGRACHGSFQGQGGMALSLFGYDFDADHAALTGDSQSESGRRVNRAEAERSLILRKPSGEVEHEGGRLIEPNSWQHRLLQRWIESGAHGQGKESSLQALEVTPSRLIWPSSEGRPIPLRVRAKWSDGTWEDVTALARFRTNDDAVLRVDDQGRVRPVGRGDTHVVVFYDNGIVAVPAFVSGPQVTGVPWPDDAPPTPIDRLVNANLRALGIVPSRTCTDAEFLRRACIDLTGTLPAPQEVEQFLADDAPDKRERKIDELLARPAFAAWWATKLCDFTGCNPQQQAELGQETAEQWYMWIYRRLRENVPYDQIVEGMMLATSRQDGQSYREFAESTSAHFRNDQPADFALRATMPHFWSRRTVQQPADKGLAVAHGFLGIRLQCAQCHKHPWDQWTQRDFEQFSRFFEPIRFGVAPANRPVYRELASAVGMRVNRDDGEPVRGEQLALARTGQTIPWREVYVEPWERPTKLTLLRSAQVQLRPGEDPRETLMRWMRDPANPWFARAFVNRVWASCFHAGIVNPPDDLNPANPPSNPALLDWLADEFIRQGYDLRWLLKEITRSATWQRSCRPNATNRGDRRHFSRAIPRRLPAEVVYDAIKQALCGGDAHDRVREDLSRRAVGRLSMRMAGTYAMDVFGKPERAVTCDCERVNEPSLLQAVFLQNDPLVHLLLDESDWLEEIRQQPEPGDEAIRSRIREAWLRTLGRPPETREVQRAFRHLQQAESPREGMEDLLWSLLNTKEFLLNH